MPPKKGTTHSLHTRIGTNWQAATTMPSIPINAITSPPAGSMSVAHTSSHVEPQRYGTKYLLPAGSNAMDKVTGAPEVISVLNQVNLPRRLARHTTIPETTITVMHVAVV